MGKQWNVYVTRMIPQEAITETGYGKRNTYLGIALCQLQCTALQIQIFLLVLSHSINFLSVVAFKTNLYGIVSTDDCLVLSATDL